MRSFRMTGNLEDTPGRFYRGYLRFPLMPLAQLLLCARIDEFRLVAIEQADLFVGNV